MKRNNFRRKSIGTITNMMRKKYIIPEVGGIRTDNFKDYV